jgi:AcrR family transcriptional regulator
MFGEGRQRVVAAAVELVRDQGAAALTLHAVAAKLSMRTPSLYSHIDSLADLEGAVAAHAAGLLGQAMEQAAQGRDGVAAVGAVMDAVRDFAKGEPGLYDMAVKGRPEVHTAGLAVLWQVLAGCGLSGDTAIDAARALRAFIHGWVLLESEGGFGLERKPEDSYRRSAGRLIALLEDLAQQNRSRPEHTVGAASDARTEGGS